MCPIEAWSPTSRRGCRPTLRHPERRNSRSGNCHARAGAGRAPARRRGLRCRRRGPLDRGIVAAGAPAGLDQPRAIVCAPDRHDADDAPLALRIAGAGATAKKSILAPARGRALGQSGVIGVRHPGRSLSAMAFDPDGMGVAIELDPSEISAAVNPVVGKIVDLVRATLRELPADLPCRCSKAASA
jgi:hypothetical protein